MLTRFSFSLSRATACALASCFLLLTGCGVDSSQSAPDGNSFATTATISGVLHGGQQPISGSTVSLYSVGTTGYGSGTVGANLLATTTTSLGGNFSFSQVSTQTGASNPISAIYGCPTSGTLLYLVAQGGDPTNSGSTSNPVIKLIDAIGPCSSVKTGTYILNEVSTVVTLAALQQYINPINETIGAPSTTSSSSNMSSAQNAILNAFNMIPQIYNQATGTLNTTFKPVGDDTIVTATPEVAKIDEIADIIASCVNTSSGGSGSCVALFAAATATSPTAAASTNFATSYNPQIFAQDTLQAALFMLQNPTDAGTQVSTCNGATVTTNLACLYSLAATSPPFLPTLPSQPTDWTLAITFATNVGQQILGQEVYFLNNPYYVTVDKNGNIWVLNSPLPGTNNFGSSLTELSPYGGFMQQALTNNGTTGLMVEPQVPAIDPSGNIWVPNFGSQSSTSSYGYGKSVFEYIPSSTTTKTFTVAGGPASLASDGAGNIFVAETTQSVTNTAGGNGTPGADVEEILANAVTGTPGIVLTGSTISGTTYAGTAGSQIAIDSKYDLWITSGIGGGDVFAFQSPYAVSPLATNTNLTFPNAISIDNANHVWLPNYSGNVAEKYINGGAIADFAGPFTGSSTVTFTAMDGAGNNWLSNYNGSAGSVSEYTNAGVLLTASNPLRHTFLGARGIAVDPSGNVWVANSASIFSTPASAGSGSGSGGAASGGFVTEILGAAVPVVTPIAAGLPATSGGTSYIGTTPQ